MMISILPLDSAHVPVSFAVFLGWYGTEGHPRLPEAFSGVQSSQTVISLPLPRVRSWKNAVCTLKIQRSGAAIIRIIFKSEAYIHIVFLHVPKMCFKTKHIFCSHLYFLTKRAPSTFIYPLQDLWDHSALMKGRGIITWI